MAMTTPEELFEALVALQEDDKNKKKPEEYRYVIYARKSTNESEGKQVRSLGDQVVECKEYAERHGLILVGPPIQEAESAKEPDIRPKFRQMLKDLTDGKYDGILSWHPDRLARNMKDAGEVIDLLDKEIIKELKFVSFSFENTTSGKMFLGITFALSKEYSDKLSDNVNRGNVRSIDEGKLINRPKHGYYKDPNQRLRPDGNNFILIKNAFQMRLEGKLLKEIATYLNQNGYTKAQKDGSRKPVKMDDSGVQKFICDPTYAGVMVYGKYIVNLVEKYNFIPAVSVPDFMTINELGTSAELIKLARKHRRLEDVKAGLMSGMVICEECGEATHPGLTRKKTKNGVTQYFYYRCDTDYCPRRGKSTRAKHILDYIYAFLDTKPFSSKESYEHYTDEMKRVSEERSIEARKTLLSLRAQKRDKEKKFLQTKEFLLGDDGEELRGHYKGDLQKIEKEIKELNELIGKKEAFIAGSKTSLLTYDNFVELMDNMKQTMAQTKNLKDLDYLCKKMYLNFTIRGKKVIKSTLSSPFKELYEAKISKGGPQIPGIRNPPNPSFPSFFADFRQNFLLPPENIQLCRALVNKHVSRGNV